MARGSTKDTAADKTGHADSPRQDGQRPEHSDHADAGGQESTTLPSARTQRAPGRHPVGAPPAPGEQHADPPLPRGGRQPQRPGQDGRSEAGIGDRDTLGATDDEGRAADKPRPRGR